MSSEDASETERRESLIELGMAKTLPKGLSDIVRVSNITALKAIVPNGTVAIAVVDSVSALWTYMPLGDLVPDGITVVASNFTGEWWRGPTLIAEQSLAQSSWLLDPQNGAASDENTGLLGSPLKTFGEIVRRWGTSSPELTIAVTVEWLSDALSSDVVNCLPILNGNGSLMFQGLPTIVTTGTLTTYTAPNYAVGTKAQATGSISWAPYVGQSVHTSDGAQFWIDADLGTDTATISQPVAFPVATVPALKDPTNGSTFQILAFPRVPIGSVGSSSIGMTLSGLELVGGIFSILSYTRGLASFSECSLVSGTIMFGGSIPNALSAWSSCYVAPGSGVELYDTSVYAGSLFNTAGSQLLNRTQLDRGTIVNLRPHCFGTVQLGDVYMAQWFTDTGGFELASTWIVQTATVGTTRLWGPAEIKVSAGAQLYVRGTTAVGALLCTGGLVLAELGSTGFTFNYTTGAYSVGAVSLSPAALDANGAFVDPRSGSRIAVVP